MAFLLNLSAEASTLGDRQFQQVSKALAVTGAATGALWFALSLAATPPAPVNMTAQERAQAEQLAELPSAVDQKARHTVATLKAGIVSLKRAQSLLSAR